jgi:hypothetical protein
MEINSACSATFSKKCNKRECWNGEKSGKKASQKFIDCEATEIVA